MTENNVVKDNKIKIKGNNNIVNISAETISKNSDSITKLIHFLSDNLLRKNSNTKISRASKTEKKMEINKLKDSLRKEIRENYGNISSVCNRAFSNSDNFSEDKIMSWIKSLYINSANIHDNSTEIWNGVHEKIRQYVISNNKDKLIEDYESEYPINCLLIYAFVKCKLLKNPEENNDTE